MKMTVTCLIEFESDNYWAGQILNGKVTLTADNTEEAKAVIFKIKGCANTNWTEESGMGDNKSSSTYSAHIDYIKSKTYLFDSKNVNEQVVIIQPGTQCFPFICHIPAQSPSSIEGIHGYIRYWVQVTIKRSWKFDKTFKKCFTVSHVQDLNHNGTLRLPIKTDINKTFCCEALKSAPLYIHVQLPQTGYVSGQLIPVNVLIANNTLAHINQTSVRLVMLIKYFSTKPKNSNSETKIISKLKGDPVPRRCKKNFDYLLPIPATPPTCTTLCSIIHITYRVEVEAKLQSIFYANQCIQTPVTIGNVPLQMDGVVVQQQPMPAQLYIENGLRNSMTEISANLNIQINNNPSISKENMEPWSAMEDIPAPVYMIATHMPEGKLSEVSEHEYGEKSFTPKYPVFNIPSPTRVQQNNGDETDGHGAISMAMDMDKTTWL